MNARHWPSWKLDVLEADSVAIFSDASGCVKMARHKRGRERFSEQQDL